MTKQTAKKRSERFILNFLLSNLGRVIDSRELREASGRASELARRLRELRDKEGYQILSHKDRAELKPRQYLLLTDKRLPAFSRSISKETRAYVLERIGYTCKMCGAAAGDPDPFSRGRTVRLTIGHIIDKSKGGKETADNLRALCANCNEGLQNTSLPSSLSNKRGLCAACLN